MIVLSGVLQALGIYLIIQFVQNKLSIIIIPSGNEIILLCALTGLAYNFPNLIYKNPFITFQKSKLILYLFCTIYITAIMASINSAFGYNWIQLAILCFVITIVLWYFGLIKPFRNSLRSMYRFKNFTTSICWTLIAIMPFLKKESYFDTDFILLIIQIFSLVFLLCIVADEGDKLIDIQNQLQTIANQYDEIYLLSIKSLIFLLLGAISCYFLHSKSMFEILGLIAVYLWLMYVVFILKKDKNSKFILKVDGSIILFTWILS